MAIHNPHIDPYLFECQFEAFKAFVKERTAIPFRSFASDAYIEEQENYKYEIRHEGRVKLAFLTWKKSDVGSGKIAQSVIDAIEIPKNNLVPWQGRFGEEVRPHQPLHKARNHPEQLGKIEKCLFGLYRDGHDDQSFAELIGIFGKKYPLIAYLFFLKDHSKYLPIAPTVFDQAFHLLGAEFKTEHRCSWENYSIYVALIGEIKAMLTESLLAEVTLLDAHSFAWILMRQMKKENKLADDREYRNLSSTEREAIVKARIGQGRFRDSLIEYWTTCAVTGCTALPLLRASHIKPWAKAEMKERLNPDNGLLLSPSLDSCFDSGYISFDDEGKIIISEKLTEDNAKALGIHSDMRLRRMDLGHRTYLKYHREHIFK